MEPSADSAAIFISTGIAICGWVIHYRTQRKASRKQHTFSVLMSVYFNDTFHQNWDVVAPMLKEATEDVEDGKSENVTFILNHYETIASGLRTGDIDERLMKDSERGTYLKLFQRFQKYIFDTRDKRGREAVYEHLEWLYDRWHKNPPSWYQRTYEFFKGRPHQGRRHKINNHG